MLNIRFFMQPPLPIEFLVIIVEVNKEAVDQLMELRRAVLGFEIQFDINTHAGK